LIGQFAWKFLNPALFNVEKAISFFAHPDEESITNLALPVLRNDGESIWLNVGFKTRRQKGSLTGFHGSATNITESKLAEQRLIESEAKFRSIAETMPGAIWQSDAQLKMHYVSPGITPLLGISPDEFLLQPSAERYPPHALKQIEAYKKKQLEWLASGDWANLDFPPLEVEVKTIGGQIKWVRLITTPTFDQSGKPTGFLGMVTDVTDLMKREEMLAHLNLVLEEGGRLAKLGTWELDLEDNRLTWSKITRELHEVAEDFQPELETAIEFYVPEFRVPLTRQVTEISTKGGNYDLELQIQTAKGNVKWVRTMGHADMRDGKCVRLWGVFQDIDESKRKSIELTMERTRLNNVIAATKVATWYWNVQSDETIFNERWAEMVGFDLADLLPTTIQTWKNLCHPDDLAIAESKLNAYFAGKSLIYETEFRMRHKNGHWVWIRDVGSVVEWTADGKPLAMYGTHEDISAAKQARIDLQAAEQKYKIIAENNFNWEFWQGTDGQFLYHSPAVERITGYQVSELSGNDHILKLIHPDDRQNYQEHHMGVTCGQKAGEISFRIIDKAGKVHYISHVCQPIFDSSGEAMGIRGTNVDVTDEHEAQVQLRKLLKAVEQSQASIVITNLRGEIEYVNPFFTLLTGYTAEEAIGNNPRILSTGHTSPEEYRRMFAKLQKGETWQGEFLNRKKNGDLYWEYATISPIKNESGAISNYVAIKEDITERKKMGENLRASELKYRLIAENTSDVIWVYNFHLQRFTYVSPSIMQLRGFTVEETLLQPIESTMSDDSREELMKSLQPSIEAFMAGDINEIPAMVVEVKQPHKAGNWVWVEVGLKFHKNEFGEVEVIGVSRDIQERKSAELVREKMQLELQQSEERFKTLFYENASAMYLINANTGKVVDANQAAVAFYGYSISDLLQKNIDDLNAHSHNWESKLAFLQVNRIGRFEFQHKLADGTLIDVELFSCLILIDGAEVVHEIVHDISARNSYLREVERQNDVLKEIAWTQSHVVRAPLARIMSLIELIDTEHASIYSEPLLLDSLKKSANELDELVHQITQKTLEIRPINEN
jgi:PAS domain S-box-containing protein